MTTKQEGVDPAPPKKKEEKGMYQRMVDQQDAAIRSLPVVGEPLAETVESLRPDPDVQKLWDALEKFDLPRKKVFELLAPHSEKILDSLEAFDIPRQMISGKPGRFEAIPKAVFGEEKWEQYKDVGELFADDFKRDPIQAMKDWEIRRVDPEMVGVRPVPVPSQEQALESYWSEQESKLEKK